MALFLVVANQTLAGEALLHPRRHGEDRAEAGLAEVVGRAGFFRQASFGFLKQPRIINRYRDVIR